MLHFCIMNDEWNWWETAVLVCHVPPCRHLCAAAGKCDPAEPKQHANAWIGARKSKAVVTVKLVASEISLDLNSGINAHSQ